MKKVLLFTMMMLLVVAGCSDTKDDETQKIVDDLGRNIEVENVEKVVSLAPSNTEIVAELGLEDKLVGITDFLLLSRKHCRYAYCRKRF